MVMVRGTGTSKRHDPGVVIVAAFEGGACLRFHARIEVGHAIGVMGDPGSGEKIRQ
jgi:hypothetical protein